MPNHLFDGLFARHIGSNAVFLRLPDGRTQSYGDFLSQAARFANTLVALGLKPGDRMALQLDKSPEMLALVAGAIAAGVVFLPLNSAYTPAEIGYFLADSGAKLLVCDGRFVAPLQPVAEGMGATLSVLNAD
ncbi:MAG: AMP-binding protein, partial [Albidovulum sp.]